MNEIDITISAVLEAGAAVVEQLSGTNLPAAAVELARARARSYEILVQHITASFPNDAILSPETGNHDERLAHSRVWIPQPLTGDATDHAIMLALLQDAELDVSAIYQPAADTLYFAMREKGAYKKNHAGVRRLGFSPSRNGVRVTGASNDHAVSGVCRHNGFAYVAASTSIAVTCLNLAEGQNDLVIATRNVSEWDAAAVQLIVSEAGGSVTDCRGRRLSYNKEIPVHSTGLLAAHPAVAFRVLPVLLTCLTH